MNFSKLQKLRSNLEVTIKMQTIEIFLSTTFYRISRHPLMNFNVRNLCKRKKKSGIEFLITSVLCNWNALSVIVAIAVECNYHS